MLTATARTNSIGHSISESSYLSGLTCKTDCFKIDVSGAGSGSWHPEDLFDHLSEDLIGEYVLGDLLSDSHNHINLIGSYMFEAGINLRSKVHPMVYKAKKRNFLEIWTEEYRYKVDSGRVYGHKRYG